MMITCTDHTPSRWASVESYLPGREVTCPYVERRPSIAARNKVLTKRIMAKLIAPNVVLSLASIALTTSIVVLLVELL